MPDFQVVIIGRPNVGKSYLFNSLLGKRRSITDETPGVTRDRISATVKCGKKSFIIIDTGGISLSKGDSLNRKILDQTTQAIKEADLLILVCDVREGLLPMDIEVSNLLRKSAKEVILVVNKVDSLKFNAYVDEFYELGLGEPMAVSATCRLGIEQLLDKISERIPHLAITRAKEKNVKVAIIGKPNVGKSSFLNYILKMERVIVSEFPGTTRDSVDTYFSADNINFLLIDTAGLVHKRKIKDKISVFGRTKTIESIIRADVCLLLIDAREGLVNDDIRIFNTVIERGKCCVIIANKFDLMDKVESREYEDYLIKSLPPLRDYPIVPASAKSGSNVLKALRVANSVFENSASRIPQDKLDEFLGSIMTRKTGGYIKNDIDKKNVKLSQDLINPATFLVKTKRKGLFKKETLRYIENRLRESFNLFGFPIKVLLK
jgi:GTP-binding protein